MKVGDKVRFLNTTGGGIVKGFKNKDIAIVDDDGFDTPVLIRECVVIEPANEIQVRQSVKSVPEATNIQKGDKPVVIEETKEGELLTVALAYLPVDEKQMTTTPYECYMVNDSNYYLSFNYMSRTNNGWISRVRGEIEPNTKLFLEEFDKTELNSLEKICLQLIPYKKDKAFDLKNAYSSEIKLDTVKFYKLHSFRENDYFEDNAIVYFAVKRDLVEREMVISSDELREAILEKTIADRPRKQTIEKKLEKSIIEIDLHIDELIDSTTGLSSADILEYQIKKFHEVIAENSKNKGQKIVFIHGKGNGTLKSAILNELKTKYKNMYYQDASFREYGFGATLVTIK